MVKATPASESAETEEPPGEENADRFQGARRSLCGSILPAAVRWVEAHE